MNINEAYLKDHLGNIRVAYYWAGSVKTQQVDSYYPFGLNIKGLSLNGSATYKANEYLYNGKLFQEEMALNWLDYGARFYDPVLGRWHSPDPMSEVSRRWSPYTYGKDNPIRFIDPDGMLDKVFITGDEANEATKQLKQSTSLTITRNSETGELSAVGEAKTESDKQLKAAIVDPDKVVKLNATSSYTVGENGLLVVGAYQGSHCEGDLTVGEQSVNMEQAKKIEDNGGAKASATVLHEGLESYAALNIGTGVHDANTEIGQQVYKQAHDATMKLPAAASDQYIFKDEGKAYPGYDTYFHQNPTTGKSVILFMYKNTPNK